MAYIEGNPLSAFVRSSKAQPERQVLALVRKLALALQNAHDHNIVHRDLKPDNVMVDKRGEPLIMDFGLAHNVRPEEEIRLTHAGTLVGTPAYMSPEQVDGDPEKIGPLSDEYSLGVILYELLTGQLPFRGSIMAVLGQIVTKEPPAPSQARPGLDPRTDALCLRMMAKNPSVRFPSLAAVAAELATILKNPGGSSASIPKSSVGLAAAAATDTTAGSNSIASETQKLQKQKTLTASDLASLEELARKCLARHDYEQVIQIAEQVPRGMLRRRSHKIARKGPDRHGRDRLLARRDRRGREAQQRADRAQEGRSAADDQARPPACARSAATIRRRGRGGRLRPRRPEVGLEKGRLDSLDAVLAFGLLAEAATAGGLFWWLGRTVIVINADQPGLAISLSGKNALVTASGMQSIAVAPGKQELTVSSPGFESVTRTFPLDRGHSQRVHVSIEDNKIVVDVEAQLPDIVEKTGEQASPPKPPPPAAKAPPSLPKAATKELRKPPEKQLAAAPAAARAKPAAPAKPPTAASELLTAPLLMRPAPNGPSRTGPSGSRFP